MIPLYWTELDCICERGGLLDLYFGAGSSHASGGLSSAGLNLACGPMHPRFSVPGGRLGVLLIQSDFERSRYLAKVPSLIA